jgi:hypothetical protein
MHAMQHKLAMSKRICTCQGCWVDLQASCLLHVQAGNGLDATGNCSTCPLGTFSEGPFGHDRDQPYHHPDADYGANGPFQIGFSSSEPRNSYQYGRALLAENVADSKATTSQFSDVYYGMEKQSWIRTGFLRCVNCTAVLADSDSTTLETGSDSPKDCICSPGGAVAAVGGGRCQLHVATTQSLWQGNACTPIHEEGLASCAL